MIDGADDSPSTPSTTTFQSRVSSDERPSEAIIRSLAAIEGVEPTELDTLYDSIDIEALDEILDSAVVGEDQQSPVVEFVASGYRIVISGDGRIAIRDEGAGT